MTPSPYMPTAEAITPGDKRVVQSLLCLTVQRSALDTAGMRVAFLK
jgi:hypothetical protein